MGSRKAQLTLGAICLLLGVMLVTQFRSQRLIRDDVPRSATDQATYISQLYESNADLRLQIGELSSQLAQYRKYATGGTANLDSLTRELQDLRMANGEVAVTGPGVTVEVDGTVTVLEIQDLINELRNASAEAIAANGVRVVTRSAVTTDEQSRVLVDRQPLQPPYRLEAVGDPDVLVPALERKGGLIALLIAGDQNLKIEVTRHTADDSAAWLKLPAVTSALPWSYAKPVQ